MTVERLGASLGASFWRVWSASALSNLSDGIFWIGLPLLGLTLTTEPALIAGVTVASRLPWLLFALVAGALADRLDRRRTMVIVDLVRVGLIGSLGAAVFAGVASIPLLYAVAFGLGILETFFDTAAQSLLPNVVARDRLVAANTRLQVAEMTMNQFVGPPVGGLLAALGLATTFGVAALGYLVAALILVSLVGSFRPERVAPRQRLDREIRAGVAYLWETPILRSVAIVIGLLNLSGGVVWSLLPLYAVRPGPMGLDGVGFGLLLATLAVGTVSGAAFASGIERRFGKATILFASIVIQVVTYGLLIVTANPVVIGVAMAATGAAIGAVNVTYQSFRQRIVPDAILGRLVAAFRVVALGTLPLGAVIGGIVAQSFSLSAAFLVGALLMAAALPSRLVVTERAIAAAEAEADARSAAAT